MKRLLILTAVILTLIATSCQQDDDAYSLGKFWIGLGLLENPEAGTPVVRLDNGILLFPIAGDLPLPENDTPLRVKINYTILADKKISDDGNEYYVRINSIQKILTKPIITLTPAIEDSIGNDPIRVVDAWISPNDLLNFDLRFHGNYKMHFINLAQSGESQQGSDPVLLELRHNRNGDEELYLFRAFVSFHLNTLRREGTDEVPITVKYKDYEGVDREISLKYTYNQ